MKKTRTTFFKINVMVILLLIPVILLYSVSNYISVQVVEEEIKSRNLNRLSLIQNQIDSHISNLTSYLYTLSADPDVMDFRNIGYHSDYMRIDILGRLMEKLMLYREQSNWASDIRLYNVKTRQAIGSDSVIYNDQELQTLFHPNWGIAPAAAGSGVPDFVKHLYQPFDTVYNYNETTIIYEIRFSAGKLLPLLEQLKEDTEADPFLYISGHDPLMTATANQSLIATLLQTVPIEQFGQQGNLTVKLGYENYLISYVRSETMDWILIDYVPLKIILSPITRSNYLFYGSVTLLLILGFIASMLLYRNVHRPIRKISRSMHKFQQGQYNVRLDLKPNDEFSIMFQQFNDMAGQIQHLIEETYQSKIITHEAKLKLLQSQINPHFLYNCLNFIKNMAKMGNEEAVEAMALHLGKYYRYIQRSESNWCTLQDEVQLIASYLEIHALRIKQLDYAIEVDPNMDMLQIPRLLIQPIAENAIVHGFRNQKDACFIKLTAYQDSLLNWITVEDNGSGLTDEAIRSLKQQINEPMTNEMGCGVWNVNQRLVYQFGEDSGMNFSTSRLGGLKVDIYWRRK